MSGVYLEHLDVQINWLKKVFVRTITLQWNVSYQVPHFILYQILVQKNFVYPRQLRLYEQLKLFSMRQIRRTRYYSVMSTHYCVSVSQTTLQHTFSCTVIRTPIPNSYAFDTQLSVWTEIVVRPQVSDRRFLLSELIEAVGGDSYYYWSSSSMFAKTKL